MIAFVGAGVVDLALLPARALRLLEQASRVVAEPSLVSPVSPVSDATVVTAVAVGEADFGAPSAELVVRLVRGEVMERARVVDEVRAARRAGHAVEVVPAVSRDGAVAAFAGVELGAGVRVLGGGESSPPADAGALLVVHPGSPRQRILAGDEARQAAASLGAEAELHAAWITGATPDPELRWFDTRPLFGKRIVVTRAKEQAADFCTMLQERGAEPVVAPAIEIHPPEEAEPLARAVRDLAAGAYDVVAFTSANGVLALAAEMARQSRDARVFAGALVAVIGPGTGAALSRLGLRADLTAPEHIGESLADAIVAAAPVSASAGERRRVLLPRAKVARDAAPERLRAAGFTVDVVAAYETRAPAAADLADLVQVEGERRVDAVTFTSTSTVTHLVKALGANAASRLAGTVVASIGPVTSAACRELGVRVDVTAGVYTISGLTDALERHFLVVDKGEAARRS